MSDSLYLNEQTGKSGVVGSKIVQGQSRRQDHGTLYDCFFHLPIPVFMIDSGNVLQFANNACCDLLGCLPNDVVGRQMHTFREGIVLPGAGPGSGQDDTDDTTVLTAVYTRTDGGRVQARERWVSIVADTGEKVRACTVFLQDVPHTLPDESRHASLDPLTRLPNRHLLLDRIATAIRHAARAQSELAVLFVDMDRFKDTNDTFGHHAGDQVLCEVANRLRACIRDSDTLGRIGGDEFAVLLTESGMMTDVARIADRILDAFVRPIELLDGRAVYTGCSVGIARYPIDGGDAETLLQHADMALYVAKAKGRNSSVFFDDGMRRAAQDRITLERYLRQAVANKAFEVVYQPVYEHDAGIASVEALVRLRGDNGELIEPGRFLAVAEDIGLGPAIGRLVLDRACAQAAAWRALGAESLSVSVNVSGRQIESEGFLDSVRMALEHNGLPPSALIIDVHESIAMSDKPIVEQALRTVSQWGVTMAIDDFGSGYSSLKRLMDLPLKVLKINRGFIQDMARDGTVNALVGLVTHIADRMGLLVVAEGVETEIQSSMLADIACTRQQGFLYARPTSAEEVTELLFAA